MMNGTMPVTTFLPLMLPGVRTEMAQSQTEPQVLDLSLRKDTMTPQFRITPTHVKVSPCTISPVSEFSDTSEVSSTDSRLKPLRPFKAYPKDPLSVALLGSPVDLMDSNSSEAYTEFRHRMLAQVQTNQGTNKNMRRVQSTKVVSDPTYWEKRKKNNEAAKRSRDARRAKEDEIAIRCAFLEQENSQLKYRLAVMDGEVKRLYDMVYR